MLHFQISPPKTVQKVDSSRGGDTCRPSFLTLGAFNSTTPKIHYERLQLGKSKTRTLIIRNPNDMEVWFKFTKIPLKGFTFSCGVSNVIPPGDQLEVDITWTPVEEGRCFEILQCQYALSGIKLSVHLLGECVPCPTKATTQRRKALVKIPPPDSLNSTSQFDRSDGNLKMSAPMSRPRSSMTVAVSPKLSSSRKLSRSNNKLFSSSESLPEIYASAFKPPQDASSKFLNRPKNENGENIEPTSSASFSSSNAFEDSLEMRATTPPPLSNEFDDIMFPFTPDTKPMRKNGHKDEYEVEEFSFENVNREQSEGGDIGEFSVDEMRGDYMNVIRRETFVVDDEQMMFQSQKSEMSVLSMSPLRRETYLVPSDSNNEPLHILAEVAAHENHASIQALSSSFSDLDIFSAQEETKLNSVQNGTVIAQQLDSEEEELENIYNFYEEINELISNSLAETISS